MRLTLVILTLCAVGLPASQTTATTVCREKSCPVQEYLVVSKSDGVVDPGCDVGMKGVCVAAPLPPAAGGSVYIECVRTSTFTHSCNAWPKGPELSYYWSPDGPFATYRDKPGDEVELVCWNGDGGVGTISVSVGSPFGLHSSSTLDIDCGPNNLE